MKTILKCLAFIGLLGCGTAVDPQSPLQLLLQRLTVDDTSPRPDADTLRAALTPAVLSSIDGPVLLVQIPERGSAAVLTRVSVNAGVETYLTPDGISLSLRHGVLVATRGLGFDLMTADVADTLQAITGNAATVAKTYRYLDGEDHIIARAFDCRYRWRAGAATETCEGGGLTFENTYLLAGSAISQSKQWVSPQAGYLIIEHLKR